MKRLVTRTLFISLFLSVIPFAMRAQVGPVDEVFLSIKSDFAKKKQLCNEMVRELKAQNPHTALWAKEHPGATLGLAVAAVVIPVYTVKMGYVATKKFLTYSYGLLTCSYRTATKFFTYLYRKVQGNNDQ